LRSDKRNVAQVQHRCNHGPQLQLKRVVEIETRERLQKIIQGVVVFSIQIRSSDWSMSSMRLMNAHQNKRQTGCQFGAFAAVHLILSGRL
jgi:hypothetical protein